MGQGVQRLRVEEVDWVSLLPMLRLLDCFRMAIHPPKLLLALLLVILLYLTGATLDLIWGARVYRGEIDRFATLDADEFANWRQLQETQSQADLRRLLLRVPRMDTPIDEITKSRNPFAAATDAINQAFDQEHERFRTSPMAQNNPDQVQDWLRGLAQDHRAFLEDVQTLRPKGIFETAMEGELQAFDRYVVAATSLRLGLSDLIAGARNTDSVLGALRQMFLTIPGWMLNTHPWYSLVLTLGSLALAALLGGSIARLAALHATRGDPGSVQNAVRYAMAHWSAFFFTPVLPILIILVLGALLALVGLVLFNWPVLDIAGGLFFGIALLLGLAMALVLIGLAGGAELFYPAVAVDSADPFDANSRAMSYLRGSPWRWIVYNLVSLVYGAVSYVFLGVLVFLALRLTQAWIDLGVFRMTPQGVERFEAILAPPRLGRLAYQINWAALDASGKVAATLVSVWVYLLIGLLGAFAVSFAICAQTWIYLLLRRAVDGTDFEEVTLDPESPSDGATPATGALPDKVEPPAGAPAIDPADALPPNPTEPTTKP